MKRGGKRGFSARTMFPHRVWVLDQTFQPNTVLSPQKNGPYFTLFQLASGYYRLFQPLGREIFFASIRVAIRHRLFQEIAELIGEINEIQRFPDDRAPSRKIGVGETWRLI